MEKRILALCCLIMSFFNVYAQKYQIVDGKSKEPLPYATILFPQAAKGLYADRDGTFVVPSEYSANDSISVSMLGYNTLHAKISDLTDPISLSEAPYNLQSIVVTPVKKKKSMIVGFVFPKRGLVSHASGPVFIPVRYAVYIPNKEGIPKVVDKLLYRCRQVDKNVEFIVRPLVYEASKNGTPGESLLHKSKIITLSEEGILEINCEETIIFPPEGLFVGIEILEAVGNYGRATSRSARYPIALTEAHKEPFTYISSEPLGEWLDYENHYFIYNNIAINAMIGLSYK